MAALSNSDRTCAAGPSAPYQRFPAWLAGQIARADEIGHLSRLAFLNGVIDRSDRELVHRAIVEWAARSNPEDADQACRGRG